MRFDNIPVIAIYHKKRSTQAVIHDGIVVWKQPVFDEKKLYSNNSKQSYYAEVGDVLFIDKNGDKELFSKNADFEWLKEEGYLPIALVTVPGKFNIYGDCSVNCISLKYISTSNPKEGTIYEEEPILWNEYGETSYDYGEKVYCDYGVRVGTPDGNDMLGYIAQPILPSNYWNELDDTVLSADGIGYYLKEGIGNNSNAERKYSPSPYLSDGSQNSLWWYSDLNYPKTLQNHLDWKSDMDYYIDKFYNDDSDKWKRVAPLKYVLQYNPYNSNTESDWYIGSTGEMGIMFTRMGNLNESITKLKKAYDFDIGVYFINQSLYTSSTSGANFASSRVIGMLSGVESRNDITKIAYCRPLIKFENTVNKVKININWNDYLYSITLNGRIYYTWNKVDYIEMPKGEVLKYSMEINKKYITEENLEGEIIVNNETTIGINYAYQLPEVKVGDIVLTNLETEEIVAIDPNDVNEDIVQEYYPIGIVTIPAEHNVYETGEVGIVGLRGVSQITPETGSINGQETFYMSNLSTVDCKKYPTLPYNSNTKNNNINSGTTNTELLYIGTTRKESSITVATSHPKEFSGASSNILVTPYLSDDSRNENFYKDSNWATSQFDGKEQTQILIDKYGEEFTPCYCVQKYKTIGTKEKDWYIWSLGEMVYFADRQKEIFDAMDIIMENWVDEFKYNFVRKPDNTYYNGILSITFKDTSNSKDRPYRIDLHKVKFENEEYMNKNTRVWFPFTRLKVLTKL